MWKLDRAREGRGLGGGGVVCLVNVCEQSSLKEASILKITTVKGIT